MATKNKEKVKLYGLMEINRSTYIKIQIIVFAFLIIALAATVLLWQTQQNLTNDAFFKIVLIIIVIVAILESLETYFTLKK